MNKDQATTFICNIEYSLERIIRYRDISENDKKEYQKAIYVISRESKGYIDNLDRKFRNFEYYSRINVISREMLSYISSRRKYLIDELTKV